MWYITCIFSFARSCFTPHTLYNPFYILQPNVSRPVVLLPPLPISIQYIFIYIYFYILHGCAILHHCMLVG